MKKFGIIGTVFVFFSLLVFTGAAFGDSVTYNGVVNGTLTYTHSGLGVTGYAGEMKFTYNTSGNQFITFCVEFTEHVSSGTIYQYTLANYAQGGGYGGQTEPNKDYLSDQTAWLYWSYLNNGVSSQ